MKIRTRSSYRYDDIAGLHLLRKVLVGVLHAVHGEFRFISRIKITGRYYLVGIYIVSEFMDSAFMAHKLSSMVGHT